MKRLKNILLALAAALTLAGSAYGDPMGTQEVAIVVLFPDGSGVVTFNKVVVPTGGVVVACFTKPGSTDALCYLAVNGREVVAHKLRLQALPG